MLNIFLWQGANYNRPPIGVALIAIAIVVVILFIINNGKKKLISN